MKRITKTSKDKDAVSSALAAVALQDHLIRTLSLDVRSTPPRTKLTSLNHSYSATRGRGKSTAKKLQSAKLSKEYVLDHEPPPLTLAQRYGLVEAPPQRLTEDEWKKVKEKANLRQDFQQPCVICKEDLGLQQHVLLSCTHVFHKTCLQSFERFTGRKSCPMCRKEAYQTRVVHEGVAHLRHKMATVIQAAWRGYVVRCWYHKLRETNPPKDPSLRHKFYQERLKLITDRLVKSLDFDINGFFSEIDQSLEASRNVFRRLDSVMMALTEADWLRIEAKAIERGDSDCPICLMQLDSSSNSGGMGDLQRTCSVARQCHGDAVSCTRRASTPTRRIDSRRQLVLLSCSHLFHATCLHAMEEFAVERPHRVCPVCRSHYHTKLINS